MRTVTSIEEVLNEAGISYKRYNGYLLGECSVCRRGKRTPCCSYKLEGVWKCHSCGAKGGIKKLIEFLQLNVVPEGFNSIPKREVYKPKNITTEVLTKTKISADTMSYKYLHSRGIDLKKVHKYLRFIKKGWYYEKGFRLVIPAIDGKGKIRGAKIRRVFVSFVSDDMDVKVLSWKGGEQYSIGINEVKNKEFALIVEGEMDFLAVKSIDTTFPVIGIPSANYKFKDELKWMPKKILIMLDNDETGKYHSKRMKKELEEKGFKVRNIEYPNNVKDFNDLLIKNRERAEEWLKQIKGA